MNSQRGPSVLPQELGQVVGDSLGTDKDQNLGVLGRDLVEVLDELSSLLKVGADGDFLGDVVVGLQLHRTNVDLDKVLLEVGSETLDLLGPGGREEDGLSVRSDLADNLPDLRLETCMSRWVYQFQLDGWSSQRNSPMSSIRSASSMTK